jgi:hypothetical protein
MIDTPLGEAELPPPPPIGVFDARFVGDDIGINIGQGLLVDYREGDSAASLTSTHELRYQVGSGTSITIAWDLPAKVSGRLQDLITGLIVDVPMTGSGSYEVVNPGAIRKLKMTVEYGTVPTGVAEETTMPLEFALAQNYPNPFNPSTSIRYDIPEASLVQLKIFNALGEELATLVNREVPAGRHGVVWDASNFPSGVYLYRIQAGTHVAAGKMILMK